MISAWILAKWRERVIYCSMSIREKPCKVGHQIRLLESFTVTRSDAPEPTVAQNATLERSMPAREPMPTSFKPFWRFLGLLFLLTLCIGGASAIIGLALSD